MVANVDVTVLPQYILEEGIAPGSTAHSVWVTAVVVVANTLLSVEANRVVVWVLLRPALACDSLRRVEETSAVVPTSWLFVFKAVD